MKAIILILSLTTFVTTATVVGETKEKDTKEEKDESLYSAFGKRDPFLVPNKGASGYGGSLDPLRKFRLEGYRLRGILRLGTRPKAMFEDPEGRSHVVHEGDLIGIEGARVSRIVNSEVIVTERGSNHMGKEVILEKIITLPADGSSGSDISLVQQGGFPGKSGASGAQDRAPASPDSGGTPTAPANAPGSGLASGTAPQTATQANPNGMITTPPSPFQTNAFSPNSGATAPPPPTDSSAGSQ